MPAFILLGWLVGLLVGSVAIALFLAGLGVSLPVVFAALSSLIGPLAGLIPAPLLAALTAVLLIVATIIAYLIAAAGIGPSLPAVTLPLTLPVLAPAPATVAASPGEFFGRGMLIGLSAAANTILLSLIPGAGPPLSIWAFTVISLSAIIFIARNRVFQGFVGWSGWVLPLSWLATIVGLILFLINFGFAFSALGIGAFAVDFTTGAIETRGGIFTFPGAFSLGQFTFIGSTVPAALVPPGRFTAATMSSHETGHTLNTAAMGGIMLYVNAFEARVFPRTLNLGYGETIAEGHSRVLPGTPPNTFAVRWWF